MQVPRKYAWKPDLPDMRDFRFADIARVGVEIPRVKYLATPNVKDQLDLGSCVFQAATVAMESVAVNLNLTDWRYLSPMFAYYNYRDKIDGDVNRDDGASIRVALGLLAKEGVCREGLWSYLGKENFSERPHAEAYYDAQFRKIQTYYAVSRNLDEMVACLASGWGFVCGISVYSSFDSDDVANTGKVPMPKRGEKFLGGHAIFVEGYDLHRQIFVCQNSWGTGWGDEGHFSLPFEYLLDTGLASDFWTIRL